MKRNAFDAAQGIAESVFLCKALANKLFIGLLKSEKWHGFEMPLLAAVQAVEDPDLVLF